jgi:regulator of protease activity HflC (stomatin/prohibitin superfamily)
MPHPNQVIDDYDNAAHAALVEAKFADFEQGEAELPGLKKKSDQMEELGGCEKCLYYCANIFFIIVTAGLATFCGIFYVQPMQSVILMAFGKIVRVEKLQGLNYALPCCIQRKYVSLAINSMQVQGSSVPDSTGSPMNVSTIVNYVVTDPVKASYAVESLYNFIHTQAYDIVRRVCGKFRYRDSNPNGDSLLADSHHISGYMADLLHKRCQVAGVKILRMDFIDIAYHSEIAAQLLQVQQAQARVDARKMIVEGSVKITSGAIKMLKE